MIDSKQPIPDYVYIVTLDRIQQGLAPWRERTDCFVHEEMCSARIKTKPFAYRPGGPDVYSVYDCYPDMQSAMDAITETTNAHLACLELRVQDFQSKAAEAMQKAEIMYSRMTTIDDLLAGSNPIAVLRGSGAASIATLYTGPRTLDDLQKEIMREESDWVMAVVYSHTVNGKSMSHVIDAYGRVREMVEWPSELPISNDALK